jgi:hypothetical protein
MKQLFLTGKYLPVFILLLICTSVAAQVTPLPGRYPKCATVRKPTDSVMMDPEAFIQRLRENGLTESISAPYYVRVFIRIVRQDNGTLAGCTMQEALDNFNQMNGQYNGHNICFQLAGMDFVNDTYLNNFNDADLLDTDYPAYIRNNNLDVDGAMTIFVHYNFLNNNGSSGNAYGIPNNFLSVARWAATSTNVNSIFGHEMGHCLGLYHTFENITTNENVTRNSASSCYNCIFSGDLCCDTPADYPDSDNNTSSTTCTYNGTATDACSVQYNPSTINIMSYQPWECIAVTSAAITANQRSRMHANIVNAAGPIFTRVSEDDLALGSGSFSTSRVRIYGAKNTITTNAGSTITHSVSSQAYYTAGSSITFGPGVSFVPGSAGVVNASIKNCN